MYCLFVFPLAGILLSSLIDIVFMTVINRLMVMIKYLPEQVLRVRAPHFTGSIR